MASVFHNRYKKLLLDRLVTDGLKVLLVTSIYAPDPDHDFVSQASANELSGTGYQAGFSGTGRQALANKASTQRNAENRGVFTADGLTWSSLGADAGTARWAIVYLPVTSDADSPILATIDIASVQGNGTDVVVNWQTLANGGIVYL